MSERDKQLPNNDRVEDIFAEGKALRTALPRGDHGNPIVTQDRANALDLLEESSEGRLDNLIPVRYWRMKASPFTFFRGVPSIMAADLGRLTPNTGVLVQCCGDCHLENFGIFATPERNLIFDINDFDETLVAPWEWDVKRLAASIHIAGRVIHMTEKQCTKAVRSAIQSYRKQMRLCAEMTAVEIWYVRVDAQPVIQQIKNATLREKPLKKGTVAPSQAHEFVADEYTTGVGKNRRIVDKPPKLFHPPPDREVIDDAKQVIDRYRDSLRDDLKILLQQYSRLADVAVKVVGIGSVGTRCAVALLMARGDDALLLQIKEARPSVLEAYMRKSPYANHGQRVVTGQRHIQAASDMFLGWTQSADRHDFYVRQLSDMKGSADVSQMEAEELTLYASICGNVLAVAHARSWNSAKIAGYVGISETFDVAIGKFAAQYADLNESDYQLFLQAIKAGRLRATEG